MLASRVMRYPGDGSARGQLKLQANDAALGNNFYSWAWVLSNLDLCGHHWPLSERPPEATYLALHPSAHILRSHPPFPAQGRFRRDSLTYYDLGKVVV